MRRVAQVIRVKPEKLAEYVELHRNVPDPVLDRLRRANIANYSIHLLGDRLFGYPGIFGAAAVANVLVAGASYAWVMRMLHATRAALRIGPRTAHGAT